MLLAVLGLATGAQASEFNEVLDLGDTAPGWKALPGVDGKELGSEAFKQAQVLVVVFTSNGCPVAVDYEARLIALAKKHGDDVAFVAINASPGPRERLSALQQRAEEQGFPFPYLRDETQDVARAFGASGTPQAFVLSADRKLRYMGAIDDAADPAKVTQHYLDNAITAVLAGEQPPVAETFAHGCRIRFLRRRE